MRARSVKEAAVHFIVKVCLVLLLGVVAVLTVEILLSKDVVIADQSRRHLHTTKEDFMKLVKQSPIDGGISTGYKFYSNKDMPSLDDPNLPEDVKEVNSFWYHEFQEIIDNIDASKVKQPLFDSMVKNYSPLVVMSHMSKETGGFTDNSYCWCSPLPYRYMDDAQREYELNKLNKGDGGQFNSDYLTCDYVSDKYGAGIKGNSTFKANYLEDGPLQFDGTIDDPTSFWPIKGFREDDEKDVFRPSDYVAAYIGAKTSFDGTTNLHDVFTENPNPDPRHVRSLMAVMHRIPSTINWDYDEIRTEWMPFKSPEALNAFICDVISERNWPLIESEASQRAMRIRNGGGGEEIAPLKQEALKILENMRLDPSAYLKPDAPEKEHVASMDKMFSDHNAPADSPSTTYCYIIENLVAYEVLSNLYFE